MHPERWRRIQEVFEAVEQIAPERRASYLDRTCADDPALRRQVESLIGSSEEAGSFIRQAVESTARGAATDGSISAGDRIGPYVLLAELGRGGMGVVYEARQEEPVRRRVALKLIKAGMDTRQVVARFESERQALALMSHPSIARVFDAGATTTGRPYFVMEYVEGVPITEYCDGQRLGIRDRLELFVSICDGVQHAHHKGIIHRDIKPSNLLVERQNGRATVKIIDFGIAKATGDRLTDKTVFTEMGQLVGTPEYMSPEQSSLTGADVDTRTDVYSLGVVLYELLVGTLPYGSDELRSVSFDELLRKIREDQPSKPSIRLSTLAEDSTAAAAKRRTDPMSLSRRLRGELDWITMRALEKDRARRYGSPRELAADIERHLRNEPVLARPASATYQLRKLVARHRLPFALAASIAVLLVGFGVAMSVLFARAVRSEAAATREAETARQALDFMTGMFRDSDPYNTEGQTLTAREILDRGAERIEHELAGQPEIRARMMHTMGVIYQSLGHYEQAQPLLLDTLETRRRTLGEEHADTLQAKEELGYLRQEQGHMEEAEALFREVLDTRRRLLGSDHLATLRSGTTLAGFCTRLNRYDEAEAIETQVLETRRRLQGDDHPDTRWSMSSLAWIYRQQGRYPEAESLYRTILGSLRRTKGDEHHGTLDAIGELASLYTDMVLYDEAEPLYREAIDKGKLVWGEEHPRWLAARADLGWLHGRQGRLGEAEQLLAEVLEAQRRVLGSDHPSTLFSMSRLGHVRVDLGRFEEAEALYREVLETQSDRMTEDHPAVLEAVRSLAWAYHNQGRLDEAEPLFRRVVETQRRLLQDDDSETLRSVNALGFLYLTQGRLDDAESLLRESLEGGRRVLGDEHDVTLWSEHNLARVYAARGRYDEAESMFRDVLTTRSRVLGHEHPDTLWTMHALAWIDAARGRHDEAAERYLRILETRRRVLGEHHPATHTSIRALAAVYRAMGRTEEARDLLSALDPAQG